MNLDEIFKDLVDHDAEIGGIVSELEKIGFYVEVFPPERFDGKLYVNVAAVTGDGAVILNLKRFELFPGIAQELHNALESARGFATARMLRDTGSGRRAERAARLLKLCAQQLRAARVEDLAQAAELFLETAPSEDDAEPGPGGACDYEEALLEWMSGRDESPKCYWETAELDAPSWESVTSRAEDLTPWEATRAMRYISRHGGKIVFSVSAEISRLVAKRAKIRDIPDSRIASPESHERLPLGMAALLIEDACRKSGRESGLPRAGRRRRKA